MSKLIKKSKKINVGVELTLEEYINIFEEATIWDDDDFYMESSLEDVKIYFSGKLVDPKKVVLKFEEKDNG